MTPFIQLKNVSKTFDVSAPWLNRVIERKPQSFLHAVSDLSFDIARGETLALVGESGCGKSTVAKLIVGLYASSTGSVMIDGQDMRIALTSNNEAARALRRKVRQLRVAQAAHGVVFVQALLGFGGGFNVPLQQR